MIDRVRRFARAALAALLIGLLAGRALAAAVGAEDESATELIKRMDRIWERRDQRGAMPDLVALGALAEHVDPNNYEVEWRMARAYFWVAYTQGNRLAKRAMSGKAIEQAERARRTRPDRVEGHYFYAIAVGEYATTIGIMQAITDEIAGKVESSATRAYEIDRDFEHGAPPTVLGRFYYMLPWPKRDLDLSRRYLEETVARHPQSMIARVYLAETYHELDEDEKAREQLAFVLANDGPPGSQLDRPVPKVLAREDMQRWFSD